MNPPVRRVVLWQGTSPPALGSLGQAATLPPWKCSDQDTPPVTTRRWDMALPPLLIRPPFLLGTSLSISQSPVPGRPALVSLQMQTPRPLGEPGSGPQNLRLGVYQAWVKFKQQQTWLRSQVLDLPGFKSQLLRLLLMSGELPHVLGPHHPHLKFPLSLTFLPSLFSPSDIFISRLSLPLESQPHEGRFLPTLFTAVSLAPRPGHAHSRCSINAFG